MTFEISTMGEVALGRVIGWAADEGWNPGHSDAACFHAADEGGFLLGRLDGRAVASISAVRYSGTFAFIGLYIVVPDLRGRGLGHRMWTAALERVAGDVVGLDGVVAQQANYAASGFTLAHRNIRFGGHLAGHAHSNVVRLSREDLADVAAYDEACFGAARPAFLRAWLGQPGATAVGVRSGSGMSGYGVIRPSVDGFKIGPLFADDIDVATAILDTLTSYSGRSATVYLDVPEPNGAGFDLAVGRGMSPVFETARMYRGGDPGLPLQRIFGITTFELG
jgi:hypothetical protein